MGMIWDFYDHKFTSLILPALQVYHSREKHINMSSKFKVPFKTYYPQSTWDFELGQVMYHMRHRKDYHAQVQAHLAEMTRMGFAFPETVETLTASEEEQLIRGLILYQKLYGHTLVYGTFDPRTIEGWTEVDLPYGELILKARKLFKTKDLSEDVIQRLTDHGMVWTMTKFKTQILPALRIYKQLHGDTQVPFDFRVPNVVKSAWTPEMWDLPLGQQVCNLRCGRKIKVDEEDKRALAALGFSFGHQRWESIVFPALVHYVKENGTTKMVTRYKIPRTDAWPAKWHGITLGATLSQMKRGKVFKTAPETDLAELRSLGYEL